MQLQLPYKLFLSLLLIFLFNNVHAQFNNSWIDYTKTYYKIKVGQSGLYRIPFSVLQSNGLGTTDASSFQMWRNGQEVPIYTSIPSGVFGINDFVEFYGEINDGKVDESLYSRVGLQLSNKWSLQTDTAVYFLTVNTSSPNKRLIASQNNVALNTLPVEPFFNYTFSKNYKENF